MRGTPTLAWTDACTSWSGKSRNTKTNSVTASILENRVKLREFIVNDAIQPQLQATDRDSAIRELVTALAVAGALPETAVDEVVAALVKREQNGSTGFGKGVAVPHVKHPGVKKMSGTIGRSTGGIDFAALDHQPVFTDRPGHFLHPGM